MFEPGHLHRASLPGDSPAWHLDLHYEVRHDAREGPMLHLRISGELDGKPFAEELSLHRDTAPNFASQVARIAERHGLPVAEHSPILPNHAEYDRMFEDIRERLALQPGEPVDLEHVAQDKPPTV
ncbi:MULTISPECIES: DUF5064 family protein [Pseudomonas]|uniref:Acetyl-CoA carboxylase alpha subunit n=1 Tax=Pseudomonas flexibilis TaxID=706570 RepID=A0A0B2D7B0_9PSED|nr:MULTISPECIES: DUF5064 family protein [Pseudomonas]KHL70449.1 hypothetical protein SF06_05330 [Pseudomonas flexibilis]KHO66033.1 acetyl-CoA carboxylase alpha subunit [Pseudomonas flexibilis]SCY52713.1 protein of unknown function [Pseudomonas flexibilis]SIQ77914.1 protein of unknown function [Pseudomonas flexibilis]